jgi:hypothetical protein
MKKIIWLLAVILISQTVDAQYFGRNKPKYSKFDFEVYETPHFQIYHYLDNPELINVFAQETETWYEHHAKFLKDEFYHKNPIILYNNHPDFQQTNTISGEIGVGTGGVTEALKNRVTMPLTQSNQKTFQVLGHELVHAFQFHKILTGDSTSLQSLANLPLFIVEGMAEYLTIGKVDAHTSMWMRDIVLNDKVPDLEKMADPSKYFPYRYGQAFWSVITSTYGDQVMEPLFMNTATFGFEYAIDTVLNSSLENLNSVWKNAITNHYTPFLKTKKKNTVGKLLMNDENAGEMNISPTISPNGKYVIFLSEKGIFTTDLYLAEARTGKIIRKVTSTLRDMEVDNLDFLESAGTFSPDSKQFAYVAFSKGKNKIIIKNIENGRTVKDFFIKGLNAISTPDWSPDGKWMAFTALKDGQSDLFIRNLKTGKLIQLTDDHYSDLQPKWSPDGKTIVFSTDRMSLESGRIHGKWKYNLATIDVESKSVYNINVFTGADNLNPTFDESGNIWFLSDRDGYRNIYKFLPDADQVLKMTDVNTGISGITPFSPALSIANNIDRVVYTHYFDGKYTLYSAREKAFLSQEVPKDEVDYAAATLPLVTPELTERINEDIANLDKVKPIEIDSFVKQPYKGRFALDYLGGSAGVGIGSGTFNNGINNAGGIQMLFSDILGDHQLFSQVSMNGEIYDFGGMLNYLNRKGRVQWGAFVSHVPYLTGAYSESYNVDLPVDGGVIKTDVAIYDLLRIFEDQVGIYALYPFSRTLRLEGTISSTYRFFRYDRIEQYYQAGTNFYIGENREKIPIGDEVNVGGTLLKKAISTTTSAAIVGDNSFFGITSPLHGHRFRVGFDKNFFGYDFNALTADFRKYQWVKPVSFAVRAFHYARSGNDADNFYPIYIGQMGLVRGYGFSGYSQLTQEHNISFNQLTGSKVFLGSAEVRLPFTGPERLCLIPSRTFFTELSAFFDAGVSFNDYDKIGKKSDDPLLGNQYLAMSTGVSLRVNLFNYLILEPYYAIPLYENAKGTFGFNIIPGW